MLNRKDKNSYHFLLDLEEKITIVRMYRDSAPKMPPNPLTYGRDRERRKRTTHDRKESVIVTCIS